MHKILFICVHLVLGAQIDFSINKGEDSKSELVFQTEYGSETEAIPNFNQFLVNLHICQSDKCFDCFGSLVADSKTLTSKLCLDTYENVTATFFNGQEFLTYKVDTPIAVGDHFASFQLEYELDDDLLSLAEQPLDLESAWKLGQTSNPDVVDFLQPSHEVKLQICGTKICDSSESVQTLGNPIILNDQIYAIADSSSSFMPILADLEFLASESLLPDTDTRPKFFRNSVSVPSQNSVTYHWRRFLTDQNMQIRLAGHSSEAFDNYSDNSQFCLSIAVSKYNTQPQPSSQVIVQKCDPENLNQKFIYNSSSRKIISYGYRSTNGWELGDADLCLTAISGYYYTHMNKSKVKMQLCHATDFTSKKFRFMFSNGQIINEDTKFGVRAITLFREDYKVYSSRISLDNFGLIDILKQPSVGWQLNLINQNHQIPLQGHNSGLRVTSG